MNEIANNLTDANNKTNNLYNNYSKKESANTDNNEKISLTTSSKDFNQEKKVNTLKLCGALDISLNLKKIRKTLKRRNKS